MISIVVIVIYLLHPPASAFRGLQPTLFGRSKSLDSNNVKTVAKGFTPLRDIRKPRSRIKVDLTDKASPVA